MKKVKLFDCTIHEGGYRNQWKFCGNEKQLQGWIGELSLIGADVIDIGVIGGGKYVNGGSSYETLNQIPVKYLSSEREYSVSIIDYRSFKIENLIKIPKVNFLRLTVTINDQIEILNLFCKKANENGYRLIICIEIKPEDNIDEISRFIEKICFDDVLVFDDIFGTYEEKKLIDCFERANKVLATSVALGFRGRNSRYQSQGIIEYLIKFIEERDFIIEASILGISRNVSLIELEVEATWLNDRNNGKFELTRIEKVMDVILKSVNNNVQWKVDRLSTIICDNAVNYSYRDIVNTTYITSEELAHITREIPNKEREYFNLNRSLQKLEKCRENFFKNKLAVIIWVDKASVELLNIYLRMQISNIAQSRINVYICNKSKVDKIVIDEKFFKLEILNLHFANTPKDVINTIYFICENYEYVWINQPEFIIQFQKIGGLLPFLKKEADIIVIENNWRGEEKEGTYIYDNNIDILLRYFINIYAVGTVIYSIQFIKNLYYDHDLHNMMYEEDLVEKIFRYIDKKKINCIGCIDIIYDISNFNHIFGIEYYIDKWTNKLEKIVQNMPGICEEEKAKVVDLKGSFWDPFTKQRIINLKMQNAFLIADKKKNIAQNNLLIAKSPKKFGRFLLFYKDKAIGKFAKFSVRKVKNISKNIKKSFGKYNGINFEANVNCIVPKDEVPSRLVFGNLNHIQEPWITIVIPVYKRADLLEDTINSILQQEDIKHPWEIVVVDNEELEYGVVNEIERLIRKINNPRILYYRNEKNIGVAGNYNRGIELARGKWVSMVHSDDLLVKGYLSRIERILELYTKRIGKNIGYISSSYLSFYSENIKEDNYWKNELKIRDEEIYEKQEKRIPVLIRVRRIEFMITGAVGVSLPSNGTVMNRAAILEMGGFNDDLGICADMVLPLRLMKKYAVYRTDEVMGHYRVGKRNISASDDNAYKVEKNYYDIREFYYRKNFFYRFIGFIFRQQHFFTVDKILGGAYWRDERIQMFYEYQKQPIRNMIMFGKFGLVNSFYKMEKSIATVKALVRAKISRK